MNVNPTLLSRRLEAVPAAQIVAAAAAAIALIGVVDHLTGTVVSLAILYLLPVAATAWLVGSRAAYALAAFAAITWAVADRIGPLAEPKARLAYLNDLSLLGVFVIVILVIGVLRREVRKQRDLIQEVQRHLLPDALPHAQDLDIASRWIPAWTVAGDYYDVIECGEGRVAVCLADVSGKGIAAALIMSNVQAIVRSVASDRRHAPDRLLATLNRLLCERLRRGLFVTVFFAIIDTRNGTLSFANAGHPPALLRRRDGSIERLQSTGPVAGMLPAAAYRCLDVPWADGNCIVVYSDGVTEYENRAGEQFGEARLSALVASSAHGTAEEVCEGIRRALHGYGNGKPFDDDLTMLVALSR
jgi:hypothetical protein